MAEKMLTLHVSFLCFVKGYELSILLFAMLLQGKVRENENLKRLAVLAAQAIMLVTHFVSVTVSVD